MRRILTAGIMVLLVGLICPLAYGEDSNPSDWEFSLVPTNPKSRITRCPVSCQKGCLPENGISVM